MPRETDLERTPLQRIPEYISVGSIAKQCGVSNTTVLRWIYAGQMPAFRTPGGHFRISIDEFTSFCVKNHMPLTIQRGENRK